MNNGLLIIYTTVMNNDDEINTNAEYVPVEELDDIVDKDGEPIDAVEKNRDEENYEEGSKGQLRRAIEGDEENLNDE